MSVSEIMDKEDFNSIIDTYIGLGTIIGRVIRETSPDDMQGMKNRIQKLSIHCSHAKAVVQKRWEDLNNGHHRQLDGGTGEDPESVDREPEPGDAEETG